MVDNVPSFVSTPESCRVCLRVNLKKFKDLFEYFGATLISAHITSIANIQISQGDNFPNRICLPCFKQLVSAIKFRDKCKSSDATLLSTCHSKKEEVKLESPEYYEEEFLDDLDHCGSNNESFKIEQNFSKNTKVEINLYNLEEKETKHLKLEENEQSKELPPNLVELVLRPSRALYEQLECHECGELFKSKCKIRVHWKKVHLPQALTCSLCKKKFSNFKLLKVHKTNEKEIKKCDVLSKADIEIKGKQRIFNCKQCPYKAKCRKGWKSHYLTHSGERPYSCNVCGQAFTQCGALQNHKEQVHKLYLTESTCHICGKFIKGKIQMYNHVTNHKPCKCTVCGKIYQGRKSLRTHMEYHSGIKRYTCELCAASFYTASALCTHKNKKHFIKPQVKVSYSCDLCKYKCISHWTLAKHKKKHTGTNFPCVLCGRFYDAESELKEHQQKLHFSEKKFRCDLCDKAFLCRKYLVEHLVKKHKIAMGEGNPSRFLIKAAERKRKKESIKVETES